MFYYLTQGYINMDAHIIFGIEPLTFTCTNYTWKWDGFSEVFSVELSSALYPLIVM